MLTEKEKKDLQKIFHEAKEGNLSAGIAVLFLSGEQKDYILTLCNECQATEN